MTAVHRQPGENTLQAKLAAANDSAPGTPMPAASQAGGGGAGAKVGGGGGGANAAGAAQLIRIEGELRLCTTLAQLWQHLANESSALLPFGQAVVLQSNDKQHRHWQVVAISGLATVNRDAPAVRWFEHIASAVAQSRAEVIDKAGDPHRFALPEFADADDPCTRESTQPEMMWVPLAEAGVPVSSALLLSRSQPWEESHATLALRLGRAYAHGALAIRGRTRPAAPWRRRLVRGSLALAVIAAVAAFVPVSLTTLAPTEVAPQEAFVVAAPYPGVVERILVAPGAQVRSGDPLVQLVDTTLQSDFQVAQQRLEVARAKTLRYQQAAIEDSSAKRELAVAQTEQAVVAAERDYARAMLDKAVIRAERDGVALYGDPRDWAGRPVAVGEAIMRVADPAEAEFRLKVPAADAVNLRLGAKVKVFLDASPLHPLHAVVTRAAYQAETDAAGVASFLVTARAEDPEALRRARLGSRGVAQVQGEPVSLFYYVLRRPITAVRQWTGL